MTLALGFFALFPVQDSQNQNQKGIWERLELYGNGRVRWESTFDNVDSSGNSVDDRQRGRLRARIGARYEIEEGLKAEARLSTSSDGNDANNPYWDFGDGEGFNGSSIVLDRLFLDWAAAQDVHLRSGKMPNAFAQPPIYGEFIWDNDVQPAGFAALWTPRSDSKTSFDVRAAGYVADEVSGDQDPKVWGAQGNLYLSLDDDKKLQVSTSFYDWGDNQAAAVAGNQGNTATTGNFLIWESFASANVQGGPLDELTGYVEYMNNVDESDEDTGYVVGAQLGPSSKRGAYNVFLCYYDVGADSLFSPVSQDDTPIAGTGLGDGMDGFIVGATYFWRDNVAIKLWALTSDADAEDDPVRIRLDFDFNVK